MAWRPLTPLASTKRTKHWEEVWLKTPHPEKLFLQGLIQVAAAFHHHSEVKPRARATCFWAGLTKLDSFPGDHRGLEIEPLACRPSGGGFQALDAGDDPKQCEIPRLHRCDSNSQEFSMRFTADGLKNLKQFRHESRLAAHGQPVGGIVHQHIIFHAQPAPQDLQIEPGSYDRP